MSDFTRSKRSTHPGRRGAVLFAAAATLALSGAAFAGPAQPADATGKWLRAEGQNQADDIADRILKEVGESGVPSSGKPRELLKDHVKKQLKDGLKQDVQSAGMERVLGAIATALNNEGKGNRCQRAAWKMAYGAVADPSNRRVVKGMGNVFIDVWTDTMAGGAGTAAKLVEMTGGKLALEFAKSLLEQLDKKVKEEIAKGGGVEVYQSTQTVGGCSVSVAVLWNKVAGTFSYMIAGDCGCKEQFGVALSKWSVSGKGVAVWKNGKGRKPFASTSKSLNAGVIVKAVCCSADTPNSSAVDPWAPGPVKVPGADARPQPTGSRTPKAPAEPSAEKKIIQVGKGDGVPKGPVCPGVKEKLLKESEIRLSTIQSNRNKANKDYVQAQLDLDAGKPGVTQASVDAAKAEKDKWVREERKERARARAIMQLEEKPAKECGEPGASYRPDDGAGGGGLPPGSALARRRAVPDDAPSDRAWLAGLTGMQASLPAPQPQSRPYVPYVPARDAGTRSQRRAARLGQDLMAQRAPANDGDRGHAQDRSGPGCGEGAGGAQGEPGAEPEAWREPEGAAYDGGSDRPIAIAPEGVAEPVPGLRTRNTLGIPVVGE